MHLRIGQHLQRNEVLVNKAAPSSVLREAEATIPTTPPVRAAAAAYPAETTAVYATEPSMPEDP